MSKITEIREILSFVLLDGQNQIHDLKDGKATPEEITERMFASLDYWTPKAEAALNAYIAEVIGEDDRDYSGDNTDEESKKFLIWTSEACNQLRAEQRKRAGL